MVSRISTYLAIMSQEFQGIHSPSPNATPTMHFLVSYCWPLSVVKVSPTILIELLHTHTLRYYYMKKPTSSLVGETLQSKNFNVTYIGCAGSL